MTKLKTHKVPILFPPASTRRKV